MKKRGRWTKPALPPMSSVALGRALPLSVPPFLPLMTSLDDSTSSIFLYSFFFFPSSCLCLYTHPHILSFSGPLQELPNSPPRSPSIPQFINHRLPTSSPQTTNPTTSFSCLNAFSGST